MTVTTLCSFSRLVSCKATNRFYSSAKRNSISIGFFLFFPEWNILNTTGTTIKVSKVDKVIPPIITHAIPLSSSDPEPLERATGNI
ncbi:MAG TPA: hypothetical protein PKX60_07755, partial [Prolixibacteraceae bacterium]|nr:hypothetical protein [Prolixibacteraceae bacterium]